MQIQGIDAHGVTTNIVFTAAHLSLQQGAQGGG